jgi:phosphoglucosamine mutase
MLAGQQDSLMLGGTTDAQPRFGPLLSGSKAAAAPCGLKCEMSRRYFGTDGIRGTVGQAPITPDFVLRLAHAVGRVLRSGGAPHGADRQGHAHLGLHARARWSRLQLGRCRCGAQRAAAHAGRGLPDAGAARWTWVWSSAPATTPSRQRHQVLQAQGTKLPDAWELAVEAALDEPPKWADSASLGKARRLDDARGRYIEFCKSTFPSRPDAARASRSWSMRRMARPTRWRRRCSMSWAPRWWPSAARPTASTSTTGRCHRIPEALVRRCASACRLRHRAGRRCRPLQMVDAQGRLFNGDELLYLMAADRLGRDEHVPGVVGTLMTNMAVEVALQARGVHFVRAKVGDRYVLEELEKHRLAAGRRGLGPPAGAGQAHHRRRHRQRAAGAAGLRAQRPDAGRSCWPA